MTTANTRIELIQHQYGSGLPVVYIQAGIHANEYPAMACALKLKARLDQAEREGRLRGQVRLVTVANPLGLNQFHQGLHQGRYDSDHGGNFNRGYPELLDALTQRLEGQLGTDEEQNGRLIRQNMLELTQSLTANSLASFHKQQLFKWSIDADYLLDLHCDDVALMHLYASKRAYDDLRPLAHALQVDVAMLADDSGGASFDEAGPGLWAQLAERFPAVPIPVGCRGCTVELRGDADVSDELSDQDAQGIEQYLAHIGVLSDARPIAVYPTQEVDLEWVDLLPCDAPGLIMWHCGLGQRVRKGDVVATIHALDSDNPSKHPVRARCDGLVMTQVSRPYARAGQSICKIAGSEPLPWRTGYLLGD